jgi:hypothetical protein
LLRLPLPPKGSLLGTIGVVALLIGGCEIFNPEQRHFPELRYYTHDFFASYEECEAAQMNPDFWINCSQTAVFCPSGRVEIMLTDIVHRGDYEVEGRRVSLRLRDNPEVGRGVVFSVSADGQHLVHHATGTRWTRNPEEEAALAQSACT